MRQCTKCKEFKAFSEFGKDKSSKDSYFCWCKSCRKEYYQKHKVEKAEYNFKYRQEHKLEIVEYTAKYNQEHKVEIAKQKAKYRQEHKLEIAKYRQEHKVEIAKREAKYYQEHKIEIAKHNIKYAQKHKLESAKYRQEHKSERAKYVKDNPDKFNAYKAKRRALKLNQIPPGTDLKEVAKFYKLAREISEKTGIKMHVDHIDPLSKGGPHCPENLRIIPASENLKKHNKLPSEFYK